jgi:hypothetical protein
VVGAFGWQLRRLKGFVAFKQLDASRDVILDQGFINLANLPAQTIGDKVQRLLFTTSAQSAQS